MRHLMPALVITAALTGCKTDEPDPPGVPEGIGLRRMADCDDLRDRLVDVVTESMVGGGYWRGGAEPPVSEDDAAGGGGDGGPTDFTGTNNQEEGVDELDLVKTDGQHLYIAQDRTLQIVDSWPVEQSHLVASVQLDGWARGLFQTGPDTLVVLEDVYGTEENHWRGAVRARVIDMSDRANPTTTTTWDLEGWLSDARFTDDQVYLVVNQYMDLPEATWQTLWDAAGGLRWPINGDEDDWEAARDDNRLIMRPIVAAALGALDMAEVMPGVRRGDAAYGPLHACDDLYAPDQATPMGLLTVAQLDPASGTLTASGLMADGWTVYASAAALYVAQTSQWWWGWDGDGETHIHRFELGGAEPVYTGSGAVTGWLYDQFAMSEFEGNLRVVTTDFGWWGGGDVAVGVDDGGTDDTPDEGGGSVGGDEGEGEAPPEGDTDEPIEPEEPEAPANHLYVLDASTGGDMPVIGHVGGIAPGETVQAVRMMGDKGYVITFRQTDPLFTLDLSDPTAPAVLGELHMPGFSAYLHPLDATHLIGVGMAGLETGELTGLAIHLFDVSDLTSPQLVDSYELDPGDQSWGWSEAMWDHHAFTFHRGVLTIPMYTWSWDEFGGYDGFSGTVSLAVDTQGVTELGRVDHHDLVADSVCIWDELWGYAEGEDKPVDEGGEDGEEVPPDDGGEPTEDEPGDEEPTEGDWSYCDWDYGYWYASVRRSVYIEDNLFTISNYGVKINDLNDPSIGIGRVLFYPEPVE